MIKFEQQSLIYIRSGEYFMGRGFHCEKEIL